jgi:hypothetical protein
VYNHYLSDSAKAPCPKAKTDAIKVNPFSKTSNINIFPTVRTHNFALIIDIRRRTQQYIFGFSKIAAIPAA